VKVIVEYEVCEECEGSGRKVYRQYRGTYESYCVKCQGEGRVVIDEKPLIKEG